jgi:secreted PhoX family phosphatase
MLSRRSLFGGLATSLAFSGLALAQMSSGETYINEVEGYGPLLSDPKRMLDLPKGFSYQVISQAGETMSDGLLVPGKADGMGCFAVGEDRVLLVRNHELSPEDFDYGAFGLGGRLASKAKAASVYDFHANGLPLPGGTTTLLYDLKRRELVSQHLSLAGTAVNCAGGVTPWGSWISCEETTQKAGGAVGKDHGWAFEVPAAAAEPVEPIPLKALGRFKHEAACVDPHTGVIYLTEDLADGLFYRMLPNDRRRPSAGGRLQALALKDAPGADTRNWNGQVTWAQGDWEDAVWVDLDGVDNPNDDLRLRGHASGAAIFARGEGIFFGKGELFFACTSGGAGGFGQMMRYVPSAAEGQPGEKDLPGRLQLFVEPKDGKVMNYADNIAVTPWGHVIACEDQYTEVHTNHLKGMTPEGKVYTLGRNAFRGGAEFAGVCFSPDGQTMFVNIQTPGITLAVTGPWNSFKA